VRTTGRPFLNSLTFGQQHHRTRIIQPPFQKAAVPGLELRREYLKPLRVETLMKTDQFRPKRRQRRHIRNRRFPHCEFALSHVGNSNPF
jgi:hypothetical protein